MSGNWWGGPSTFAKLSRILLQTFAKIRLEVALNLTRKLQNSHKLVSTGWGLLLQRRILRRHSGYIKCSRNAAMPDPTMQTARANNANTMRTQIVHAHCMFFGIVAKLQTTCRDNAYKRRRTSHTTCTQICMLCSVCRHVDCIWKGFKPMSRMQTNIRSV